MQEQILATLLAIFGTKQDLGKSVLAICLADALASIGHRTLLVDMDPQATVLGHYEARNTQKPYEAITGQDYEADLAKEYDYIIFDNARELGLKESDLWQSMRSALDIALCPTGITQKDLKASSTLAQQLAAQNIIRASNEEQELKYYLVPSRIKSPDLIKLDDLRKYGALFGVPMTEAYVPEDDNIRNTIEQGDLLSYDRRNKHTFAAYLGLAKEVTQDDT